MRSNNLHGPYNGPPLQVVDVVTRFRLLQVLSRIAADPVLDYISDSLVNLSFNSDQEQEVRAAFDDAETAQEAPRRGLGRFTDARLSSVAEAVRLTRTPETVDIKTKHGVKPFKVVAWHDDKSVTIETTDGPKRFGSEKIAR